MTEPVFILDRDENPHPALLELALTARRRSRLVDNLAASAYWLGILHACVAATGSPEDDVVAWLDANDTAPVPAAVPRILSLEAIDAAVRARRLALAGAGEPAVFLRWAGIVDLLVALLGVPADVVDAFVAAADPSPGVLERTVHDPMIHYHGGPITPETCALRVWSARHAFVSYAEPRQVELAAAVCQSFALDNGAFSLWRAGRATDWPGYYDWCRHWLRHPGCDWAVIPDVIGGTEAENDALVAAWPLGETVGVPVWHLDEPGERLEWLAARFPRVALGSAAAYDVASPRAALARLADILPAITDADGYPRVKLHGLRMLRPELTTRIPLATADSTNVARNIGLDGAWRGTYAPATKEARADVLVERMERHQPPARLDLALLGAQASLWAEVPA